MIKVINTSISHGVVKSHLNHVNDSQLYLIVTEYQSHWTYLAPRGRCHSYHSPGHSEVWWAIQWFPFFGKNYPVSRQQ